MSASRLVARAALKEHRATVKRIALKRLGIARRANWARRAAKAPITSADITPLNADTPTLEKEDPT